MISHNFALKRPSAPVPLPKLLFRVSSADENSTIRHPLFSSTIRPGRRGRAESNFGSPAPAARGTHVSHGASLARTHARALARTGRGTSQLAGWLPPTTPWRGEIHCFLRGLGGATSRARRQSSVRPPQRAEEHRSWLAGCHPPPLGVTKSIVFFED